MESLLRGNRVSGCKPTGGVGLSIDRLQPDCLMPAWLPTGMRLPGLIAIKASAYNPRRRSIIFRS